MGEQEQRIRHLDDQIWASLCDRRADIERIADRARHPDDRHARPED